MPEIPDLETYLNALRPRVVGQTLERVRLSSPFLLRSAAPPLVGSFGLRVRSLRRIGKRIVFVADGTASTPPHALHESSKTLSRDHLDSCRGLPGSHRRVLDASLL
jgi:formamidopyrimidine-DNA glycosylase